MSSADTINTTTPTDTAVSPLDHPLTFTQFLDKTAETKKEYTGSLRKIAGVILKTNADAKPRLPWFKFAIYGDMPTEKGSLRHDANVTSVTGLEGDYDREVMQPEEAASLLKEAGVAGVIYTTPSHTDAKPRWRVVCPLSNPHDPAERAALVARLNGVLGGVLAREFFVLSQGFFYGSINHNPAHRVLFTEGRFLDLAPELEARAIGYQAPKTKDAKPKTTTPTASGQASIAYQVRGSTAIGDVALQAAISLFDNCQGETHQYILEATLIGKYFVSRGDLDEETVIDAIERAATVGSGRDRDDNEVRKAYDGATCDEMPNLRGHEFSMPDEFWQGQPIDAETAAQLDDLCGTKSTDLTKVDVNPDLIAALSLDAWAGLAIPPKTRYLGDLLATASRVFLSGGTGLGKTQMAHAFAGGIASGTGFLHWHCDRPARVLVIDGEMSTRLIKDRLGDTARRGRAPIPPGNLVTFALDRAEEFAKRFPDLGECKPFNTHEGRAWVQRLIRMVQPEVIIFDNLMSLVTGDQTTETPWSETLPLVAWIRSSRIAQMWLDHTGIDRTRQYGSATKRWSMDTAGMLLDVPNQTQVPDRVQFKLSFDAPHGKTRERCKENWSDFASYTITLEDDKWSSVKCGTAETVERVKPKPLSPMAVKWHSALQTCLNGGDSVSMEEWYAAGVKLGIADAINPGDSYTVREAKRKKFSNPRAALVAADWIAVDGDLVEDLHPGPDLADLTGVDELPAEGAPAGTVLN